MNDALIIHYLMQLYGPYRSQNDRHLMSSVAADSKSVECRENDSHCPSRGEGSSPLELRALAHSLSKQVGGRAEGAHRQRATNKRERRLPRSTSDVTIGTTQATYQGYTHARREGLETVQVTLKGVFLYLNITANSTRLLIETSI
jgi:hypothetical protein